MDRFGQRRLPLFVAGLDPAIARVIAIVPFGTHGSLDEICIFVGALAIAGGELFGKRVAVFARQVGADLIEIGAYRIAYHREITPHHDESFVAAAGPGCRIFHFDNEHSPLPGFGPVIGTASSSKTGADDDYIRVGGQ